MWEYSRLSEISGRNTTYIFMIARSEITAEGSALIVTDCLNRAVARTLIGGGGVYSYILVLPD